MVGSDANRAFDRAYRVVRVLTGPLTRFETALVPESALAAMAGPSIIASNHRSIFDAVAAVRVLGGMDLDARPLSASWLWEVPALGSVLDRLQAIPLEPGRAALAAIDTAVSHLQAGGRLLVTPEGRVVAPEHRVAGVGEGHKIVSRIACAAQVPVVPGALTGTDELWPLGRRTPVLRPWQRPVVRAAFGPPRVYGTADHRSNVEATMADIAELIAALSSTARRG